MRVPTAKEFNFEGSGSKGIESQAPAITASAAQSYRRTEVSGIADVEYQAVTGRNFYHDVT